MSTFWLKIIAITAMVIDHIGAVFYPEYPVLRMIGRLTFPIFAFLLAEGAYYTRDINKYVLRMLGFALISEVPFDLAFFGTAFYRGHQNVMWTFFFALSAIWVDRRICRNEGTRILFAGAAVIAVLLANLLQTDYHGMGVLLVLVFYVFREKPALKFAMAACLMILFGAQYTFVRFHMWQEYFTQRGYPEQIWQERGNWLVPGDYTQALACAAFPMIAGYNGKKGAGLKYFFYIFYPLHLLIIGLIAYVF